MFLSGSNNVYIYVYVLLFLVRFVTVVMLRRDSKKSLNINLWVISINALVDLFNTEVKFVGYHKLSLQKKERKKKKKKLKEKTEVFICVCFLHLYS